MKLNKLSVVALLAMLAFPLATFAFTFNDGDTKLPNPINDDYYTVGENVTLDTPVFGDMMAAGAQVEINAPVSQDVGLVGGNISVKGEVGDDARLAGGDIKVDSIVKSDLVAGGGNITLGEHGFVGGDFVFGAGTVRIDGTVNGNVLGATNELYINNEIKGNVRLVNVEKIAFGPNGKILGDLSYHGEKASPDVTSETVKGKIDFSSTETPVENEDFGSLALNLLSGFSVFGLLSLLFTGLFCLWAFRHFMVHAVDAANLKPLPSLGIGFLVAFVIPVLALVLLITGIGLPLATLLFLAWLLALLAGKLVGILLIGLHAVKADHKSSFPRLFWAFSVGAFAFSILGIIPVLGWIMGLLINLLGMGGLILVLNDLYHSEHKKKLL
jgi:hypothetical protein